MMSTEAALPSTAPSATDISKEINATTTTATKDNDVASSIDHSATMTTTKNDAQDMSTPPTHELDISSNTNNINRSLPDQFDTTSRKVVIHNVLKYIRTKEITKLTNSWLSNIPPHITEQLSLLSSSSNNNNSTDGGGEEQRNKIVIEKIKKPPKDNWIKVTLKEEYMVDPFIELINTCGPPPPASSSNETKDNDNGSNSNSSSNNAMRNARGGALFAKRADEMFTKNRNDDEDDDDTRRKRKERGDENGDGKESRHDKRMRSSSNRPPIKILSNDEV